MKIDDSWIHNKSLNTIEKDKVLAVLKEISD